MLSLRTVALAALAAPLLAAGVGPAGAAVRLCQGEEVTIEAPASGTTVRGTKGPDVIDGIGRNSITILGLGGDDVICSGPGVAVVIEGGDGADRIEGGDRAYEEVGHAEVVALAGGAGDDVLRILTPGTLTGGPGNDRLVVEGVETLASVEVEPGPGDDVVVGGGRSTTLILGGTSGVRIVVPDGVSDGEGHDTFSGVRRFVGTEASDSFVGGAGPDDFTGEQGKFDGAPDMAVGGPGRDSLDLRGSAFGQAGRDSLRVRGNGSVADGGPGSDFLAALPSRECAMRRCRIELRGGVGRDLVHFESSAGRGVRVDLAQGRARHGRFVSALRSVEDVVGTKRPDVLLGNERSNRLAGGKGRDVLNGRGGRDLADGGPGRDHCRAEVRRSC
ncbi:MULTISPECIES: calcium-binding protein [unclassified Nocardioides]|uniref:calcium-binding protein n=1 Tax=unclassified Nocardioides TaxID=2615069 RepID=UPI003015382F